MSDAKLRLPQQDGGLFLTDGGIETVLIFQEGIALPEFAAFVLLESKEGRTSLRRYFRRYLELAAATPEAGFVLESPTWRAGIDWGAKLGFDEAAMRRIAREQLGIEVEIVVGQPPIVAALQDAEVELRYFFCGVIEGDADRGEYAELRWVPRGQLREYDFDDVSRPVVEWLLESR